MIKPASLIAAAVLLAGCVTETPGFPQVPNVGQGQASQIVQGGETLRITDVRVEAARAASAERRGFNVTEERAEQILRASALDVVDDANPAGTRDVTVAVDVGTLFVPNVISGAAGQGAATVSGRAQLFDAATGAALGAPFDVSGSGGFRLAGTAGAVLTAGALSTNGEDGEIANAGSALGRNLSLVIYGIDPAN